MATISPPTLTNLFTMFCDLKNKNKDKKEDNKKESEDVELPRKLPSADLNDISPQPK